VEEAYQEVLRRVCTEPEAVPRDPREAEEAGPSDGDA
jgi:hypothetical protein